MLIDEIVKICTSCGLVDDTDKSLTQLATSTLTPNWEWTDPRYTSGDKGYSFCLTDKHIPPAYFDKGGTQLMYIDTHTNANNELFIKNLWLYLPTITHSNHLRFMQRVITNEIYKPDIIFNGINDYFIDFNDSKESFIPEISCDGTDDLIIDLIKKYLTNVAAICKSLK